MAIVGGVDAGENLPQGALARAVLAAQRVAGSGRNPERDVLERHHAGKTLRDVLEPDGVEKGDCPLFHCRGHCRVRYGVERR